MSAVLRGVVWALALGFAGSAHAQTWPVEHVPVADRQDGGANGPGEAVAYVSAGRSTNFRDAPPQFWLAVFDRRRLDHSLISFHWISNPSMGLGSWTARRRTSRLADVQTRATTARDCPALAAVIAGARTLTPPAINLPGLPAAERSPYEDVNIIMDDDGYAFGANAAFAPNDALGTIQFSGGSNSALGVWGQAAEEALAPCWRPLDQIVLP